MSSDFEKILNGQNQLAHIAAESGGEAYFLTPGPLLSIAPFLADINQHLQNQYLLEFRAFRADSADNLADVQVKLKKPAKMMVEGPSKAFVPPPENRTSSK